MNDPATGSRTPSDIVFEPDISCASVPFLGDHRVGGGVVLPAAAYLEMAWAAAGEAWPGPGDVELRDVRFEQALLLSGEESRQVRLAVRAGAGGRDQTFLITSAASPAGTPASHARGAIAAARDRAAATPCLSDIRARCTRAVPPREHYQRLADRGVHHGAAFQGIEALWTGSAEAVGRISLPAQISGDADAYYAHPVLLDSCLQVLTAAADAAGGAGAGPPWVLTGAETFRLHARGARRAWSHAQIRDLGGDSSAEFAGDVTVIGDDGAVLAEITGIRATRVAPGSLIPAALTGGLLYAVEWQRLPGQAAPEPDAVPRATDGAGRWIVVDDGRGLGAKLRSVLADTDGECLLVARSALAGDAPGQLRSWFAGPGAPPCRGVVFLGSPAAQAARPLRDVQQATRLLSAAARLDGAGRTGRIWLVTRGAQQVTAGEPADAGQAALWGLGRVAALEHPGIWGGMIDLPQDADGAVAQSLAAALTAADGEDQVALRADGRYAARLVHRPSGGERTEFRCDPAGVYLITGGLGGLGLLMAEWLADRGARNLVLAGRHVPPPEAAWNDVPAAHPDHAKIEAIRALRARGVQVTAAAADVGDRGQVENLIEPLRGRLRGVIHAAAVLRDTSLYQMDDDSLERVLRPKALGAAHLDSALAGEDLGLFVLFSSAASLLGSPGQANYAAANAYLDALAHDRRRRGLAAMSVNWGPWAGAGSLDQERHAPRLVGWGIHALEPATGCAALAELIATGADQAAVLAVDWDELAAGFPAGARRPFLREVASQRPSQPAAAGAGGGPGLAGVLAAAEPAQRRALLTKSLRARVAAVLGARAEAIAVDVPISGYGFDSMMAVEVRNGLEQDLGVTLPMSGLISGPTIEELTAATLKLIDAGSAATPRPALPAPGPGPGVPFPLSRGQEALWFIYRTQPDSIAYNITTACRITSDIDPQAFVRAWASLVERHPMLRANFMDTPEGPRACIRAPEDVNVRAEDARGWSPQQLARRLAEESERTFDLEREAPLRVRLLTGADGAAHILVISVHHIVADLWSMVVLLDELGPAYLGATDGMPLALPPVPVSYADYARWQRELVDGAEGAAQWSYWAQQLGGELPVLALPADRPRPAAQSHRGATVAARFDSTLLKRAKELAAEHDTTLFTVLLASLFVLLHRETGQDDIIIGSPTTGRSRSDFAKLVGYLIQPLPLRADLSGNPRFGDFLRAVRETVLGAFDHENFPIVDMVRRLNPTRDASFSPLFQTMFVLQKPHALDFRDLASFVVGAGARRQLGDQPVSMRLHDWAIESLNLERHTAMFDLTWMIAEADDGLMVSVDFNTDLFEEATARRFLEHFRVVLSALAEGGADTRVGLVPVAPAGEAGAVVHGFNDSAADFGADACARLEQLVARRAADQPESVAVVDGRGTLSYAELMGRASRVAGWLRGAEVRGGDIVGVLMEKGWEQVAAVLGVLGSGAAYLPADPGWPAERIRQVLSLAGARVVVTQPWLADQVARAAPQATALVLTDSELAGAPPADLRRGGGPSSDPAYVIFTSGSTGVPKGVVVDHRAAVNTVLDVNGRFGIGPADRVLGLSALTFDLSVWDIFGPLTAGGALVLPDRDAAADPAHWAQLAASCGVTVWNSVPQLLGLLADELEGGRPAPAGLRLALLSGDWIPLELPDRARAVLPGLQVIGLGGATEAAIWSIAYPVTAVDPAWRSIPYGAPAANQRWYVLDRWLRPCPLGVAGELFIGGAGIALGYLGDPLRTAERFVADPFGPEGARLYRTGDMGRWRADGTIEFLGRADSQVKVRGFRVEPGEIEAALRQHAQVGQAVVTPWPAPGSGPAGRHQRLVAYVVPADGHADRLAGEEWSRELRSFVAERLPDYMVPARFVVTGALPLSANGKIDKSALPAPAAERPGTASAAPRGQTEQTLAQIWSELLDAGPIGRDDNFFELGGDSILSIQIVSRAAEHGIVLKPTMIFQHQTVAELAAAATQTAERAATPLTPIGEASQETLDALIEEIEEQEDEEHECST